jgi:hypothetical protein
LKSSFQKSLAGSMWRTLLLLLLGLHPSAPRPATLNQAPSSGEIAWVTFCDLVKNPTLYEGKEVRTKVVYRHGGEELAEFYCAECLDAGRVSAGFDDSFDSNTTKEIARKLEGEHTLSLVVVGRFYGSSKWYGHFSKYRFLFKMSRVEKAKVLLKSIIDPNELPKNKLSRVCCE